MPVGKWYPDPSESHWVWRYYAPHIEAAISYGRQADRMLRDERRARQQDREQFLEWAKASADRQDARLFGGSAKDQMRQYRAACLLLGWYGIDPLPGDCPASPPSTWPIEIATECDMLFRRLSLPGEGDESLTPAAPHGLRR